MKLIGIDVGGTFTDIIFTDTDEGTSHIHKVPTTKEDPSIGMISGVKAICERNGIPLSSLDHVFHGTTIATNSILEHDGAKTGMITTEGYRDILHIGRHQRPQNYSIAQEIPWQDRPLIERRNRMAVKERLVPVAGQAEVETALDEQRVREIVRQFKADGIESVVVGLLFSYLNSEHEDRVAEIIREEDPDMYITTSSGISPQFREFERFTTAALNGFVGPKVQNYVDRLEQRLKEAGITCDLHIMSSSGGVATARTMSEKPVLTLLSGPAAGVLGGQWAGNLSGRDKLITFDVGGTSADIAIITEHGFGESSARDTWIAGFPVQIPMIDIHTIGAGGGSIALVDSGGAFQVGPRSAGSYPGPASYGRGGQKPTVTDAHVALGHLDPDNFLGGEMQIYPDNAVRALSDLAAQLGLGMEETAEGLLTIVNNNMANAIRAKTVQKGYDPRGFSLLALGGAGPMHAVEVAKILGVPEVIIPPHPGITSATGLLTTDLKYDATQTLFLQSTTMDLERVNAIIAKLEGQIRGQLEQAGFTDENVKVHGYFDCRYIGQGYELRVMLPDEPLSADNIENVWSSFHLFHEREYGHSFEGSPIEIVNLRLTGIGAMPKIGRPLAGQGSSLSKALVKTEKSMFRVNGKLQEVDTNFYSRDLLPVDTVFYGPCVVLQKDTTTIIPPDCTIVQEATGNMIIKTEV
ncbi:MULTISPECIES: hydantoinase/oxoprolinase family protein [unclassified Paenibacillus]|uniref:hydantoinase/oxoprolinase family protein n=1 Tax=unclassified Paenibacillus TaxID=185978 RepID=UPI00240494DE|nr:MULTISPECIES: hydantoinase/oxoprolinase family protein [unclassified Paenibacillus]MDF9844513.1 N-methylhydantoinase A [Paenibacillus sp. PastF-2]MDF9851117.1 N-methylhydantoinase A [Paenibacillus sp. PastM-2]MDF9857689.1 N-methylhydantoinase A [Paenibacillus sp. PastF-1]MDH6482955.1 N-methylhydantoinase A [Paenibacillus sp. PastH-2]MDH6510380.1 N-methylhydantoinase A [Paenibacillus sp. PastM-3]